MGVLLNGSAPSINPQQKKMKALSRIQINALADKYINDMRKKREALSKALLEMQLDAVEAVINAQPNADMIKQLITGENGDLEWRHQYKNGYRNPKRLIELLGVSLNATTVKAQIELEALPRIPFQNEVAAEITLATIDATSIDDIMAILSAKFE